MRLDIHVHFHDGNHSIEAKLDEAIGLLRNLMRTDTKMRDSLTQALAAAQAEVTDIQGKEASTKAWIEGEPERQRAALQAFADEHDIDEDAAAATIQTLSLQLKDSVGATFDAINANPGPADTNSSTTGGTGDDTITGGQGDDSLVGGQGGDSTGGGQGDDSLTGGQADDSLTGGQGDDSLSGGAGGDSVNPSDPGVQQP